MVCTEQPDLWARSPIFIVYPHGYGVYIDPIATIGFRLCPIKLIINLEITVEWMWMQ
jgi:hypothetical protein